MNDSCCNRRVVFQAPGICAIEPCETPMPGVNELQIRTECTLISTGTELTMLHADAEPDSSWQPLLRYPQYPGYSNVGRVTAVGEGVSPALIGQRVLSLGTHASIVCRSIYEAVIVPAHVSAEEAVFGVIAQIAMGGVRFAGLRFGETAAVFGAGLIGQFAARFARMGGASAVFVSDRPPLRLRLLPSDSGFYVSDAPPDAFGTFLLEWNRGQPVDAAFDATGDPARIDGEMRLLADRGRLIILSSPRGRSTLDLDYLNLHALSLIGAHNFYVHTPPGVPGEPFTLRHDLQAYVDLLARRELSVDALITHRYSAADAADAYQMLWRDRRNALGVLLDWR